MMRPYNQLNADGITVRWNFVPRLGEVLPPGHTLVLAAPRPITIDAALREKIKEIKRAAEAAVLDYVVEYPDFEQKSWTKQEAEATAWMADPNAPTPFLDGLAAERGVSREVLIEKAFIKAQLFAQVCQKYAGIRQRLEDEAKAAHAAEDLEALKAVRWPRPQAQTEPEDPGEGGGEDGQPV